VKLLSVEDARARMLEGARPLGAEAVILAEALGRVLAADVVAGRDQPPFAASAMDGWAVRAADRAGARRIVAESAAGRGWAGEMSPGEAVRIFTGAALPRGADAVVIQEEARREGDDVIVPAAPALQFVREAGRDFRAGERLLERGLRLDPWRLALAAAAGRATLEVISRPRVAILSTGEEIAPPGARPGEFQIFDSAATAMAALVSTWGGAPALLTSVGDDAAAIAGAASEAVCDMLVTLGGASVGDHDLVKPALRSIGLDMRVESVAVRPGKPTWFGVLPDGRRVVGLPGNPASAMVCAELFLRPLLRALLGLNPALSLIPAKAAAPIEGNGQREHWMRATLERAPDGGLWAVPFADQDSSMVALFAQSDALLRRGAAAPAVGKGGLVEVLPLERAR
jgi:molybdopterin molybdotransferase